MIHQPGVGKYLFYELPADLGHAVLSSTHSLPFLGPVDAILWESMLSGSIGLPCLGLDHFKNTNCTEGSGQGSWFFVCNSLTINPGEDWLAKQGWARKGHVSLRDKRSVSGVPPPTLPAKTLQTKHELPSCVLQVLA